MSARGDSERFFELSEDLLLVMDDQLRAVRVSPSWEVVLGRPPAELTGRPLIDLVHPADAEAARELAERAEPLPANAAFEVRMRHADGDYRWIRWHGRRNDGDGLMYGIGRDVTEQRRAADALVAGVERLEEAERVAQLGSFHFDHATSRTTYTTGLFRLYGLDPDRDAPLRTEEFLARIVPEDRATVQEAIARSVATGGPCEGEFRFAERPDRILHARVATDHEDGRPVVTRGTVQDVTAFRAAERAVADSERRLAEAELIARVGSFEYRVDTEQLVWSPGLYRIYGVPEGTTPLAGEAFRRLVAPEDAGRVEEVMREALAAQEVREVAFRIVRDGRPQWFTSRAEGYVGPDGVLRLRGTVQDVTAQRRALAQSQALARLGGLALAGVDIPELLDQACSAVTTLVGAQLAAIAVEREDGAIVPGVGHGWDHPTGPVLVPAGTPSVLRHALAVEQPVLVGDWEAEERFPPSAVLRADGVRSSAFARIPGRDRPYGVLSAHARRPGHFEADDLASLTAVAAVLGTAIDRRRGEQRAADLAVLRGRLVAENVEAEERTRRRISEALHDGALQDLLAARQDLVEAEGDVERADMIRYAREGVERAVQRLRDAVHALHPVVLQHGGLEAALAATADEAARRGGFTPTIEVGPEAAGVRDDLVLSLATELLTNAAKHAQATAVRVAVRRVDEALVLEVEDDGVGADPERVAAAPLEGHIGLASLAQRAAAVGGTFDLRRRDGGGTTAVAVLPVD